MIAGFGEDLLLKYDSHRHPEVGVVLEPPEAEAASNPLPGLSGGGEDVANASPREVLVQVGRSLFFTLIKWPWSGHANKFLCFVVASLCFVASHQDESEIIKMYRFLAHRRARRLTAQVTHTLMPCKEHCDKSLSLEQRHLAVWKFMSLWGLSKLMLQKLPLLP